MRRVRPSWNRYIQIVNHSVVTESTQWVRIVPGSSLPSSEMQSGSADKGEGPTRSLQGEVRMCQKSIEATHLLKRGPLW